MLKRDRVRKKLVDLGFSYKTTTDRTYLYKRGTDAIFLPKKSLIDPDWVRAQLRDYMSSADIETFIREAKT